MTGSIGRREDTAAYTHILPVGFPRLGPLSLSLSLSLSPDLLVHFLFSSNTMSLAQFSSSSFSPSSSTSSSYSSYSPSSCLPVSASYLRVAMLQRWLACDRFGSTQITTQGKTNQALCYYVTHTIGLVHTAWI